MKCKNCKAETHTPDEKTGLIHTDGLYSCHTTIQDDNGKNKVIRLDTVAE